MMQLAASRQGPFWLAVAAFCEGIFFPIPPDLMLMPMVLARRERAWLYAGITLVASMLGGSVGYLIGMAFEGVGRAILALTGTSGAGVESFKATYRQWGIFVIALPIPFKLTAIVSGMTGFSYPLFLGAAAAIRGARFLLVAGLVRAYGPPIQSFVEKRLALVISGVAVALVLGVLGLKLLH
jgi:membrane protein YqaA with SNARE-associated domain